MIFFTKPMRNMGYSMIVYNEKYGHVKDTKMICYFTIHIFTKSAKNSLFQCFEKYFQLYFFILFSNDDYYFAFCSHL